MGIVAFVIHRLQKGAVILVTETEIIKGLVQVPEVISHYCLAFFRSIDDITEHIDTPIAER